MLDDFCSNVNFRANKCVKTPVFISLNSIDINGPFLCLPLFPSLIIRSHYTHSSPIFMLRTKVQKRIFDILFFLFQFYVVVCAHYIVHPHLNCQPNKIYNTNKEKYLTKKKRRRRISNHTTFKEKYKMR